MQVFVMLVFIFGIGAMFGWGLEVIYRRLADKEKRWFNPGFCVGPYLPIYGIGLVIIFLITYLNDNSFVENEILRRAILFIIIAIFLTLIELIAGIILLKFFNMRLWDYRNEVLNYKGFICIKFSFFWMLLGAIYYFFIHERVYESVVWLSNNLVFSFFVGAFFATFIIDAIYSGNVIATVRDYAVKNGIIVAFEDLKDKVSREIKLRGSKPAFFIFMFRENLSNIFNSILKNRKKEKSR